jgi:hypothetical protein
MNDFTKGVKAKLKSRSTIYGILFLALLIAQQIYEGYNANLAEQEELVPVIEQAD